MARDFRKTGGDQLRLGINYIGSRVSGASAVSVAARINWDTLDTATYNNRVFQAQIEDLHRAGILLSVESDGASSNFVRFAARSVTTDALGANQGTTNLVSGAWHHIGGVADFAGDKVRGYANGSQEFDTSVTFANSSFTPVPPTTTNDLVSGDSATPSTASQFDGRIAEIAVWSVDIGTAGFAQLAKGVSPLMVRPDALVAYYPIYGTHAAELDVVGGTSATTNGSPAKAEHPRIFLPTAKILTFPTAAAGGVTGTSATTNAADTSTASGTVGTVGAATPTNAADTATASGTVGKTGTSATTNAADTASAAGKVGHVGTSATTNAADTSDASGAVGASSITGTSATTNAPDTSSAAGKVGTVGAAAASNARDTATAVGTVGHVGSAAATNEADTASAVGTVGATTESDSLAGLRVHAAREMPLFFSIQRTRRRTSRASWPALRAA